jgi:hypothetical protein
MVLLPSTDEHDDNHDEHDDNHDEHDDNPDEHDDNHDEHDDNSDDHDEIPVEHRVNPNLVYMTKETSEDTRSVVERDLSLIMSCFVGNFRCIDRQDTIIGDDTHSIAVTIFLFQGETEVDDQITITSAALEEEMKSRNVVGISLKF